MSNGEIILTPPQWDLTAADNFIRFNWVDTEDWFDADNDRKTALCNVSWRVLSRKFSGYEIPNEAVYLFAAVLAAMYNDTNKLAQQGIASFSVGKINFTFKNWAKKELDEFIPREVYDLIGAPYGTRVLWTVL